MRNNLQNDVKVENDKQRISKFNFSGSISTSESVGRVSVGFAQTLIPGSRCMVGQEQLVRMAPLAAPVYSKQKFKTWHMFVPIEDVWPNFGPMMTQQAVGRNGALITPAATPHLQARELAAFCLQGAKCSIYLQVGADTITAASPLSAWKIAPHDDTPDYRVLIDNIIGAIGWTTNSDGVHVINIGKVLALPDEDLELLSGNGTTASFVLPNNAEPDEYPSWWSDKGYDKDVVTPDGADFKVFNNVVISGITYRCMFCFRLSSWGQNFAKTLNALGYPLDFSNSTERSLLPLMAVYKAYWDVFGLNMWMNWEQTNCDRLKSYLVNLPDPAIWSLSSAYWQLFKDFILNEVGAMWLTEQNDYVSAHLPQPTMSKPLDTPLQGVLDVIGNYGLNVVTPDTQSPTDTPVDGQTRNLHAFMNVIGHGAMDEEILKRLYKATNRNTLLGRKIEALMSAMGLGTYMQRTRINYIGDTSIDLEVTPVTSQADTFKEATSSEPASGEPLGAYSGKGVGYRKHDRKLYCQANSFGWYLVLQSVTCDSGYSQGEDMTTAAYRMQDFFSPLYDGVGLEVHAKSVVNCRADSAVVIDAIKSDGATKGFGFATRYSGWKVGRNVSNGSFCFASIRDNFIPYIMDKLFFPEQRKSYRFTAGSFNPESDTPHEIRYDLGRVLPWDDVPTAGNSWRFLNRFPWLSNLARIFHNQGKQKPWSLWSGAVYANIAKYFEYLYLTDENYMIFNDVTFKCWAPALPIEESYGTVDPEKKEMEYLTRC